MIKLTPKPEKKALTEELVKQYSNKELAKMFGVSESTLKRWKKELGLSGIKKKEKEYDWKTIFELYNPYIYKSHEIAKFVGCHPTTVRRAKIRLGYTKDKEKKFKRAMLNKIKFTKKPLKDLADIFNLSISGVSKMIKRVTTNRYNGKHGRRKRIVKF